MINDEVNVHLNLEIEPWEVSELLDEVYPIIHKVLPSVMFEVNSYKRYEEEYGGFEAYAVLTFKIAELTQQDIVFIKKVITENI